MSTKKATGRGGVVRELVTSVPGIFQASSVEVLIINDAPESIARKTMLLHRAESFIA